VRESIHGEALHPGTVWIAAGGHHLEIEKTRGSSSLALSMSDREPVNFCRPSVDLLFESAAQALQDRVLAVQLTGMGKDGLTGAAKIVGAGGTVLAQDQSSSVVWGMPGAVAQAGLAEELVPITEMAGRVRELCVPSRRGARS